MGELGAIVDAAADESERLDGDAAGTHALVTELGAARESLRFLTGLVCELSCLLTGEPDDSPPARLGQLALMSEQFTQAARSLALSAFCD